MTQGVDELAALVHRENGKPQPDAVLDRELQRARLMAVAHAAVISLSLIHISEPTRPY